MNRTTRTTEELLQTLPERVRDSLEQWRKERPTAGEDRSCWYAGSVGCVLALYDMGMITDRERQKLFLYTTV